MARIILHGGAHKTASKHLQHNLLLNKAYLETKGVKYIPPKFKGPLIRTMLRVRRKFDRKTFDLQRAKDDIRAMINDRIGDYENVIFSYEGIFGSMNMQGNQTIYATAEPLIELYGEILEEHEVIPAYAIRNYSDYVLSAYKWLVKNTGYSRPLSKFLADFDREEKRWSQIIEALAQTFDQPFIWNVEAYKSNPDRVLMKLLDQITPGGVEPEALKTDDKKRNTASDRDILKMYYAANQISRGQKKAKTRNLKISKRFKNKSGFFGSLLKNPVDVDVHKVLNTAERYRQEVEELKQNPGYEFLLSA